MEKCQGICSYKRTPTLFSIEQLKSGANCLTPDGDTSVVPLKLQ